MDSSLGRLRYLSITLNYRYLALVIALISLSGLAHAQPGTIKQKTLMMQKWAYKSSAKPKRYQTFQSDAEYQHDLKLLEAKFKQLGPKRDLPMATLLSEVAKSFIGTPYRPGMLDLNKTERPIFYLSHLDCITLLDNSLALTLAIKTGQMNIDGFMAALEVIRYRNGHCNGYASRLHYTTDWFYDLTKRGLGQEITQSLGGIVHTQRCCLITGCDTKPNPADSIQWSMKQAEAQINIRKSYYLSFPLAGKHFDSLRTGDIIGFTSFIRGLDVKHTGMVIRQNGKPYLLHADSDRADVEIGFAQLDNVLWTNNRVYSGIKVWRIAERQ